MRSFDHASFANAFGGPKSTWVSYGIVNAETPEEPSVQLTGQDGGTLAYGPMLSVTLQPSGRVVSARVGSMVAGAGEAEYYPFVAGDEVVVLLPEGHERGGAVVVSRLNQSLDAWPSVVAGQDATKNTFGFRRMRTPFVVETAASYLIRSAVTGAQIGIDPEGKLILSDGDQGTLVIGPEAVGIASGDGTAFVHVLPPTKETYIGADTTTFLISPNESQFISQSSISFATAGGMASGHGVTAEQVVAFVIDVVTACAAAGWLAIVPSAAVIQPIVASALAALQTPVPTDSVPGGVFATYPTIFGPTGLLNAIGANPLAAVDVTGTVPGYGRAGFKL